VRIESSQTNHPTLCASNTASVLLSAPSFP